MLRLTGSQVKGCAAFELGQGLEWEKSRVSKQVARMASRGLVVRQECPEDRGGAHVAVTPKGRRAIEQAAPAHVELVRRLVFDELSAEHVRALRTITESVLRQLEVRLDGHHGSADA